jgi:hypothetical protein
MNPDFKFIDEKKLKGEMRVLIEFLQSRDLETFEGYLLCVIVATYLSRQVLKNK